MLKTHAISVLAFLAFLSASSLVVAQEPFTINLSFTKTGWSPSPKPPDLPFNSGFLMVNASWDSKATDKDEVTYEGWLEGRADWGSANMPVRLEGSNKVWTQKLFIPAVSNGGLKGIRVRMNFTYRPPGVSSYASLTEPGVSPLPPAPPLAPGTHPFTCFVSKRVGKEAPVIASKSFEVTIAGAGKDTPFFLSGLESRRVFQRSDKEKGPIEFYLRPADGKVGKKVSIIAKKGSDAIASVQVVTKDIDERIIVPNVTVGGEYAVEVTCDGAAQTVSPVWMGDVWVIGGQSNAVGCGGDASLGKKAMPGVEALTPKYGIYEWQDAADGLFESTVGAWVTAAQFFHKESGVPVGLVGHAIGGRPIDFFMDSAHKEMPFLKPLVEAYGKHAAAFFWYQGESDSFSPERCQVYGERLAAVVSAVRRYADNPQLYAGVVQLSRYLWQHDDQFAPIRQAQLQLALGDPNAAVFSTLPCEINDKDKIHLLTPSYIALGEQIGKHMVDREKNGKAGSPGPLLSSAAFASQDRLRVIVKLKNAVGLTGGDKPNEWFVTDAKRGGFKKGGFVPIKSVTVESKAGEVLIELAEPAGEGASLSYGFQCDIGGTLRNADGFPAPAFVGHPISK